MSALSESFRRVWRCNVVASGYHNGAHCTPDDPHGGWGCGYRHVAVLTDEQWDRLVTGSNWPAQVAPR
jgi:hypothetical protein